MKIALFSETFLPGVNGVTATACRLAEHLTALGHTVRVYAPDGGPDHIGGAAVVRAGAFACPLYAGLRLGGPWPSVTRDLDRFQPDIVHCLDPVLLGLAGVGWARRHGTPLVTAFCTDLPAYARYYGAPWFAPLIWALLRRIHRDAAVTLCPSSATLDRLAAHGFSRLERWGRGVDTARFDPGRRDPAMRARLGAPDTGTTLLLYVGRLAAEKRLAHLAPLLDLPGVHLALVGDGPQRAHLERLLAGRATFTGYLAGRELAEAYAAGDIFVFPSPTETFGNVVLEALASGLPVVAPRSGGPVDLVATGVTGYLYPPEAPTELTRLTAHLAASPALRRLFGNAARAEAVNRSWPVLIDRLVDRYRGLVAASRPRRRLTTSVRSTTTSAPARDSTTTAA